MSSTRKPWEADPKDLLRESLRPRYRVRRYNTENWVVEEFRVGGKVSTVGTSRDRWVVLGYYCWLRTCIRRLIDLELADRLPEEGADLEDLVRDLPALLRGAEESVQATIESALDEHGAFLTLGESWGSRSSGENVQKGPERHGSE